MDMALVGVTLVAVAVAGAMALVTWGVIREQQRQSAARIAALIIELQRSGAAQDPAPVVSARTQPVGSMPPRAARPPTPPAAPPIDVASRAKASQTSTAAMGQLFTVVDRSSGFTRRLGAAAVAGTVLIALASAAILGFGNRAEQGGPTPEVAVELVALEHEYQAEWIVISGSVRNPDGGAVAHDLSVLALAFGDDESQVASGRQPIRRSTLSPGAESAFAISLPARGVRRYRVSFLVNEAPVLHVDRRVARAPGGEQS